MTGAIMMPRFRFSLRGLMIAVAAPPLVVYAGIWGQQLWGPYRHVIYPPDKPPGPVAAVVPNAAAPADVDSDVIIEEEYSPWAAVIAMVSASVALAMFWRWVSRPPGRRNAGRVEKAHGPP
jgi:hypothetical protein